MTLASNIIIISFRDHRIQSARHTFRSDQAQTQTQTQHIDIHSPKPSHCSPPSLLTRLPNHPSRLRALLPHLLLLLILIIIILPRIRNLILKNLNQLVKHDSHDGADAGPHPVDPVLLVEDAGGDAGAEGARRVQGAAGVVDACELGDEERQPNADGSDEGCWGC